MTGRGRPEQDKAMQERTKGNPKSTSPPARSDTPATMSDLRGPSEAQERAWKGTMCSERKREREGRGGGGPSLIPGQGKRSEARQMGRWMYLRGWIRYLPLGGIMGARWALYSSGSSGTTCVCVCLRVSACQRVRVWAETWECQAVTVARRAAEDKARHARDKGEASAQRPKGRDDPRIPGTRGYLAS